MTVSNRTVRAPRPRPDPGGDQDRGLRRGVFTSSSTVRNLVGIAGKLHARTIVAYIGPQTAETAREIGLRVDVQPEEAGVPALVDALAAHAPGSAPKALSPRPGRSRPAAADPTRPAERKH